MKAFKAFNKDMTCRGFQFKEGETYHEDDAKLCSSGFHACEDPLDCFGYYAPANSIYREVELDDVTDERGEDSKRVGKTIKIGAEIGLPGIIKAHFEYVKRRCTNEQNAEPGKPATAGSYGAATAGYRGAATAGSRGAATAGDSGAATAGSYGAAMAGSYGAATAGYRGAATAGYIGAATAGDSGAATAGDRGAATAGSYGAATSRGSSASGKNGLSVARGNSCKVKGGMGAVLVLVEENEDDYDINAWAAAVVDGEKIKADTWYMLKNGVFVEVDE